METFYKHMNNFIWQHPFIKGCIHFTSRFCPYMVIIFYSLFLLKIYIEWQSHLFFFIKNPLYSILIVIGYSGRDQHINKILLDCLNTGLTIYWFKYGEEDFIPFSDCPQIIIREQDDYNTLVDTTKICCEDLEYAWVEM